MEKDNLIKNKNARDEKTFKKRKIINGITAGAILVSCAAIGAAMPLLFPVIGGALATSSIAAIAGIGAALNSAGAAMATFGIIKSCLICGAAGATVVGGGIVGTVYGVKHKPKTLKEENKSSAESLEKIDNKSEKVVNNTNQVKVSSPQEVNENVEKGNELAK